VDTQLSKKKFILIIGLGNIGERHLESLLKFRENKIFILEKSKKKIYELKKKFKNKISYLYNLQNFSKSLDLVIIATNSDVRHNILNRVIKKIKVKSILLEKVVFQKLIYFNYFIKKAKKKNIKIFVNCPRRLWKIFEIIKENFNYYQGDLNITFKGNNWGLCSNAIHFIDIWFYILSEKISNIQSYSFLSKKILNSKRKNFFELKGKINFESREGHRLLIEDSNKFKDSEMSISFNNLEFKLLFKNNKCYLKKFFNNRLLEKNYSTIPLQSNLTSSFLNSLKARNYKRLTTINESFKHHELLFKVFNEYFNKTNNTYYNVIPIT
jgi:hypothetical protein